MNSFAINPVNLIRTLVMALDLAVNGVNKHQWRTAVICKYIADAMQLGSEAQHIIACAALMHDIGAAPDYDERDKLLNPEQEKLLGKKIFTHAEKGYYLLKDSVCFQALATPVRHHHDAWEGGNPSGFSRDAIPLASRIIHVADRVEVSVLKNKPALGQSESVNQIVVEGKGVKYDPDVVDAFLRCSEKECFWLDIVNPSYAPTFLRDLDWGVSHFTAGDLLNVAELYATLIDRMSSFTATHSRSVSRVATLVASHNGFNDVSLDMMRIAGLLHDIGKLSVPNSILEKPGKLDKEEVQIVRQHTYYTYRILEQVEHWQDIAKWAAFHHETLDGKGYPFKKNEETLPLGSRIMAVADIFVALAEDRPYRKGLERAGVEKTMKSMVANGKIDGRLVDSLFDVYQDANNAVLATASSSAIPKVDNLG